MTSDNLGDVKAIMNALFEDEHGSTA